jgi:hypothetical protein
VSNAEASAETSVQETKEGGKMKVMWAVMLAVLCTGCSIKVEGEWSILDKHNKHLTITKRTETNIPAQPTPSEEVDTQEVKVNSKEAK